MLLYDVFYLASCISLLALLLLLLFLMLEPLRAELGRNLIFFFVKDRIDFIEIGEDITLDDRGRITLMSLLG